MTSSPVVPTRVLCPDAGGADVGNDLAIQYSPRVHDAPQRLVCTTASSRKDVGRLLLGGHIPLGTVDLAAAGVQLGRQRVAACKRAGGEWAYGGVGTSQGASEKRLARKTGKQRIAQLPHC